MLEKFKEDLIQYDPSWVASKWILDNSPEIFRTDFHAYIEWKESLATKLGVDSRAISFTGSACVGFSLNPTKRYQLFNDKSDVDIAIISQYHFDISWHCLRNLGNKRYKFTPAQQASVKDHVNRLIYWGTIATDKILSILPFANLWVKALDDMSKERPTDGKDINVRIYKDFESLRAYTVNNLKSLKDDLVEEKLKVKPNAIVLENNT